ncbi:amino acid ABC transporter ATP-binding/permease protein [Oceaniovalibus sp. ACAM 378]|uniref:amino acid ABC transporter ATP-binding/permease protein n=1 Tax=Oceaniovalibus sp. ACAM 378 TaxID=2599923 RepID=UPI0011D5101E|nr:ATP-binding cassette domain-containing protein [Oceaniovalibus sp. ACAM 378]TYB87937.1 ATP-binding cassette domain-containing protein [Oceaniovalibus sp. ACAM 378]
MRALVPIIRLLLTAAPWAMARGAALTVIVLLMGAALLGLSGWFITATGIAGLAGIGIAFDVFRPSAGVRFLALGRTAARYGERILTHDATLRALAALRVTLLRRQSRLGDRELASLRSEAVLTRIVSDVDALDGVLLRLVLPLSAAFVTHAVVFLALGWLAGWPVAWAILGGYAPVAAIILWHLARRSIRPSDEVEAQDQRLRHGVIDMIRNRQSLILGAMLAPREAELLAIDAQSRKAARALDRVDRNAGAALSALVAATAALALMVGGWLVARDMAGPAIGAIGVFVALALAETLLPLRRGFSDYGRMIGAARRIGTDTKPQPSGCQEVGLAGTPVLTLSQRGLSIELEAGDAVALTGPSGSGKTSLLMQIAGLADNDGISILGRPPAHWADAALRKVVTMVPQRSALIAGTIRENLSLAGEVEDAGMWRALDAVALGDVIRERGGLDARLNEGGAGLSGGQARRLSLARAVLKSPRLLLLDEPTEGLDADTANRVLWGLRNALPEAAIIATLHRSANHPLFTRQLSLQNDEVTNLRLDLQV